MDFTPQRGQILLAEIQLPERAEELFKKARGGSKVKYENS
jgi:hypothetical protein